MSFHVRFGADNRSLSVDLESFEALLALIKKEFASLVNQSFRLSYFDEEHEKISVSCWNDFKVAMEEHSVMKKILQLYVELGDNDEDDDDLVVINNSPNVIPKQLANDAQSQTAPVERKDALTQTQTQIVAVGKESGKDEKQPHVQTQAAVVPAPAASVSAGSASPAKSPATKPVLNSSFWSRLFSGAPSASPPPSTSASASSAGSPAAEVQSSAQISPTFSMLLLSDLGELLSHLRVETINQLDAANAQDLSTAAYGKVKFERTKRIFEEELRAALADLGKPANSKNEAPVAPPSPLKKAENAEKVEEADDALAAIEKEEMKEVAKDSAPAASYAAVVAASVGASTSPSSASLTVPSAVVPAVAAPAVGAAAVAAPAGVSVSSVSGEKKSAEWSAPVGFSMSADSVSQVLQMCRELGFTADASKVKYFMSKSNGDYAALIDWLMTDSVVKLSVPK